MQNIIVLTHPCNTYSFQLSNNLLSLLKCSPCNGFVNISTIMSSVGKKNINIFFLN